MADWNTSIASTGCCIAQDWSNASHAIRDRELMHRNVKRKGRRVKRGGGVTRRSEPISQDYWQRLTDKLSFVLDGAPAYWAEAPDPQRLLLFCRTLDELRSQCAVEGLER